MEEKRGNLVFLKDGSFGKGPKKKKIIRSNEEKTDTNTYRGEIMDNNKILEKYIDSVDKDRRETERRLTEDRREMEKRLTEERRLSEERINKNMDEVLSTVKEYSSDMKNSIDKLETKVEENSKHIRNLALTTIWSVIGVAVAVLALATTVIFNIFGQ